MSPAIALLLIAVPAQAEAFQPPISGDHDRFTIAIGEFRIETEATPTKVEVEKPVRFTIRITAMGPVKRPPRPPALAKDSYFSRRFHVEMPDPASKQQQNTW